MGIINQVSVFCSCSSVMVLVVVVVAFALMHFTLCYVVCLSVFLCMHAMYLCVMLSCNSCVWHLSCILDLLNLTMESLQYTKENPTHTL